MRFLTKLLALSTLLMLTACHLPTDAQRPPTTDDPTPAPAAQNRHFLPWLAGGHPSGKERYVAMDAAIDVAGGFAYLASEGRLQVIDVSDPTAPARVGSLVTSEQHGIIRAVSIVALSGNHAYLLDLDVNATPMRDEPNSRLLVVDVSAPTSPWLVTTIEMREMALNMVIHEGWLYVPAWRRDGTGGDAHAGLMTFDLSDPAHPRRHGFTELGFVAIGIAAAGENLLLAGMVSGALGLPSDRGEIRFIDIGQPGEPVQTGKVDAGGGSPESGVWSVVASGDIGAILSGGRLRLFDLAGPTPPAVVDVGEALVGCGGRFVAINRRHVVVIAACDEEDRILVLEAKRATTDPPMDADLVGQLPLPKPEILLKEFHHPLHMSDDALIYLATSRDVGGMVDELTIIDASTPTAPRIVGRLP